VLRQLTTDHSLVQEMVDEGTVAPEAAKNHPQRNVVTRAVGIEPALVADFVVVPTVPECRLLLCSDGAHGELDDEVLTDLLTGEGDAQATAEAIVAAVLSGRAPDNVTAVVVDLVCAAATADDDLYVTGPAAERDLEITAPRPRPTRARVSTATPPPGDADSVLISVVPTDESGSPTAQDVVEPDPPALIDEVPL
ncbi:MAG TPA: hypothetical protein PLV68_20285, partial [Ilumatobacteraceae bacterium]|nr:hypothetical protein [Ilumatobacteraceae bacterium]